MWYNRAKGGIATPKEEIRAALLAWYAENGRPLPWRVEADPYRIWLSEAMLQQTRIEAVIPYYERFIARCPDVYALAALPDGDLMKLWEGLGYYSRARHLKEAAKTIVSANGGEFPHTFAELKRLPGIGDYTAGAIASIAFGERVPAVDGNVVRVYCRLTGDTGDANDPKTKERVREGVLALYPQKKHECRDTTQAWMELGETVCIPNGAPKCDVCPLAPHCAAHREGKTDVIPVRSPKKARRIEDKTVFILNRNGEIAVVQRPPHGLLASMWLFPMADGTLSDGEVLSYLKEKGLSAVIVGREERNHIFTHIEWKMHVVFADVTGDGWSFVRREDLDGRYAVPSAHRKLIKEKGE